MTVQHPIWGDVSARLANLLERLKVRDLIQLSQISERQLRKLPNVGSHTVQEVRALLERFGMQQAHGRPLRDMTKPELIAEVRRLEKLIVAKKADTCAHGVALDVASLCRICQGRRG